MSQLIEQALVARLLSLTGVTALVGAAIYKSFVPQTHDLGAIGPAMTYEVSSKTRGRVLAGSDGTATVIVKLSAWSYSYSTAKRIIEAVFNGIDGPPGTWGDGTCQIVNLSQQEDTDSATPPMDGSDRWVHRISGDYKIQYRVAIPTLN